MPEIKAVIAAPSKPAAAAVAVRRGYADDEWLFVGADPRALQGVAVGTLFVDAGADRETYDAARARGLRMSW